MQGTTRLGLFAHSRRGWICEGGERSAVRLCQTRLHWRWHCDIASVLGYRKGGGVVTQAAGMGKGRARRGTCGFKYF